MKPREALVEMFCNADQEGAQALLEQYSAAHGYEALVFEVLGPALSEIGERWNRQSCSLAHAYIAVKVAEGIMKKYLAQKKSDTCAAAKGPVVMGNIEDDFHGLGRSMVTAFLQINGWEVRDLGNDVTPDVFVDTAVKIGAKVIGASAMMYSTAVNIKALRAEIDRRGLSGRVQLAAGGAVFVLRPELVAEVGADGTACNAIEAPALFTRLYSKACQAEGGA